MQQCAYLTPNPRININLSHCALGSLAATPSFGLTDPIPVDPAGI